MRNIYHDVEIDRWIISDEHGRELQVEFDPAQSNSFMELHKNFRNELSLTASFSPEYNTASYRVLGVMQVAKRPWDNNCTRHEMVVLCKQTDSYKHWLVWLYADWPDDLEANPVIRDHETQAMIIAFETQVENWTKTLTHMFLFVTEGVLKVPKRWFNPCISGNKSVKWAAVGE